MDFFFFLLFSFPLADLHISGRAIVEKKKRKKRQLKHLTIKLNFVKKTNSMLYPVKIHLKYQGL